MSDKIRVRKVEFARIAGVTPQAITKNLRSGLLVANEATGLLDLRHPVNRAYLETHAPGDSETKGTIDGAEGDIDGGWTETQSTRAKADSQRMHLEYRRAKIERALRSLVAPEIATGAGDRLVDVVERQLPRIASRLTRDNALNEHRLTDWLNTEISAVLRKAKVAARQHDLAKESPAPDDSDTNGRLPAALLSAALDAEQAKWWTLQTALLRRLLIPAGDVRRAFAAFDVVNTQYVLGAPERVAGRIPSMCRSSGMKATRAYLREELTDAASASRKEWLRQRTRLIEGG